jgi:hypothetical protein
MTEFERRCHSPCAQSGADQHGANMNHHGNLPDHLPDAQTTPASAKCKPQGAMRSIERTAATQWARL